MQCRRLFQGLIAATVLLALAGQRPAGVGAAPPGPTRLFKSGPIQITADGRWVWVADAHADAVTRIDTQSGAAASFPLPDPARRDVPRGLAVTEDGAEVWVAAHDSDKVYVLDGTSGALKVALDMPWGSGPYSVALSRPGGDSGRQAWALVALHRMGTVAAIDTATRAITLLPSIYRSPFGIAWTEDGATAWITHLYGDGEHPHLSKVDVSGGRPRFTAHMNAFAAPPRNSSQLKDAEASRNIAEGGYLNFRGHPAQVPSGLSDRRQLWIPTQYMNMTQDTPTPDSVIQASLRKLDLATERVLADDKVVLTAVQVHDPTKGDNNPPWLGYGWNAGVSGLVDIGFAEIGDRLYAAVVGEQSDDVVVLPWNTTAWRSKTDPAAPGLPETPVGDRPMGIAIAPDGRSAYVYNAFSSDVSVLSLTNPSRPAETRRIPLSAPIAGDPLADATLAKGAKLFFSSTDPRLSSNQKVACASCHVNGEHDGRHWSFQHLPPGTAGQKHGPRGTISLLGLGQTHSPGERDSATGWGQIHRSGDRDEIQDFEHTLRGPLMGGTGFLGAAVQAELGPANAGRNADLDAMAAYLLAVPPLARSPHRAPGGALSEPAVRGATFFKGSDTDHYRADAQCATCHVPDHAYLDHTFHDVGGNRPTDERELNDAAARSKCLWCANTPSLLGVWDTAPYEGVYRWPETFNDVLVDFKDPARPAPHGDVSGLTGRQLRDLAEFVQSIDGNLPAAEVRGAKDSLPPRIVRVAPTSRTRVEVWFSETVGADPAGDPDNYAIERVSDGSAVPVLAADWDGQNGDRVTLITAPMAYSGAGVAYRLRPTGGIVDAAHWASGGTANPIDPHDTDNTHTFTLGETLTITLGASGYENLTIPVHDVSPIGPGLSTWIFDRVQVATTGDSVTPGFVRFAWRELFARATGVRADDMITGARFSLQGSTGDARVLEIRRVLQSWRDPDSAIDWNQNPVGAPTWRDHAHPDKPWNRAGAAALGTDGRSPSNYNGAYDLAETVDADVEIEAINARVEFRGERVTDAFRLWFEHPELDYGYAVRARATRPSQVFARFESWESNLRLNGPVLTLTYRLPEELITPGTPTVTRVPEFTRTPERDVSPTPTRRSEEVTRTPTRRPDEATPTPTRRPDERTATPTSRPDERTATPTNRPDGRTATPTRTPIREEYPTPTPRPGEEDWREAYLPWAGNRAEVP